MAIMQQNTYLFFINISNNDEAKSREKTRAVNYKCKFQFDLKVFEKETYPIKLGK